MATPASTPTSFSISPLPENVYDSYDDAEAALHAWNRRKEIDVSKSHHKKNNAKEIWQRDFKCDKYGQTQNNRHLTEEERIRVQRGTSKIGCTMKIRLEAVNKNDCSGRWKIVYLKGSALHTHPASEDPSIHPGHRRRDMQRLVSSDLSTQTLVSSQTAVGIAPVAVVATIRHAHPETSILAKDVANHKRVDRREALASNTPTELLLKQLSTNKFFFKYKVNPETSHLQYLFWSHPGIKQFYKWNSDVLIMDCTYKTNAYDLPLLNIIAMTNMNTVLPIAQCWLSGEKEDDFLWTLEQLQCMMTEYAISKPTIIITDRDQACMNALDRSFSDIPSLVCRWHMNRNVLAKTRTFLDKLRLKTPLLARISTKTRLQQIISWSYTMTLLNLLRKRNLNRAVLLFVSLAWKWQIIWTNTGGNTNLS